jgi:predicted AlkP superfamily phosphohydrolase/phosphomutase
MVSIDSMSLPFAKAHLEALPALGALVERSVLIEPKSSAGYLSASVWASFASCLGPGAHGQYFPFQWDARRLSLRKVSKPIWRDEFDFEPFWYAIARAGIETTVLDAGGVLNDHASPCRQVTNWSYQSTGDARASDPALLAEIRKRFGRRPIGKEVPVPKKRAVCRHIRDNLTVALKRKTDAVLWLMERDPWRFFFAGFYEVHRAGHNLWPVEGAFASEADPDAMLEVYKEQDRQLARIVERIDSSTTLVVLSLHGMAANVAQDHFLQKILARLNARYLAERGLGVAANESSNLAAQLRKLVPFEAQHYLANVLGEDVQDFVVNRSLVGHLDWAATPSFKLASGGEGIIRLNIKGREARGFFDPGSKELTHYVSWLERALLAIRVIPSGEALIKSIHHAKDLFPGPRSHLLPDLVLEWAPQAPAERIASPEIGEIHEKLATGRGGNHVEGAFALVSGPGAALTEVDDIARIEDIGRFAQSYFGLRTQGAHAGPSSASSSSK